MKYSLNELAKIVKAKHSNIETDTFITGVEIDSRKIKKNDLFIPFVGENVDGHLYIDKAFENGASCSLATNHKFMSENILLVDNPYTAIQDLAKDYLSKLKAKVIAITGSNGKTTTKDIISSILSTKYKVYKTQGNFNNELGLPLTILNAPEDTEILVLEMGTDGFGQLEVLSQITTPDFAVITNIGESHIEFFKDRAGIAKGKFEITSHLKKDGIFIYNGDEPLLNELNQNNHFQSITCGFNHTNDIVVENYNLDNTTHFKLNIFNQEMITNLKGKHNILNIMFAISIAKKLNITDDRIIQEIANLDNLTKMRLEEIKYHHNSLIINDAYNASPTSMKAAIDIINNLKGYQYKTLVLGDMYELGKNEVDFHIEIANYIENINHITINKIITVGKLAKNISSHIHSIEKIHFNQLNEVSSYLLENQKDNEIILFKASRGMKLEGIIEKISEASL